MQEGEGVSSGHQVADPRGRACGPLVDWQKNVAGDKRRCVVDKKSNPAAIGSGCD